MRPVPNSVPVSFAYKRLYRNGKPHKGVDFGAKKGTKVTAAIAGKVYYAGNGGGWGPSYGAHVIVKGTVAGKTRWVQVAHLSRIDVKTGQTIKAGQQLGRSGGIPGQWGAGNSTGNHVHFQVNKSELWSDHVDPWPAIKQGAPAKPTKSSKPASHGPWYRIGTYNLKSPTLTRTGKHRWSLRRARQITAIKAAKLDVLCLQEVGSPTDARWYDAQLKPLGLVRVAGSKWRYIYIREATVDLLVGGTVELAPLYKGDTKQMAWAALDVNGSYALVNNWHLEEDNGPAADRVRVQQSAFGVTAATKNAVSVKKNLGVTIARDRWAFAGDTNSQSLVAAAMKELGFVSAFANALKTYGSLIASFNNWLKTRNGKSVDCIFVDVSRPVESATQKPDSVASDHNFIYATLGRKA